LAWLDRQWEWTFAEDERLEGLVPSVAFGALDDLEEFRYDVLASLMRMKLDNKDVKDMWTDKNVKMVAEGAWYSVFRVYCNHLFKELRVVRFWVRGHRAQLIGRLENRQVLAKDH